MKRKQFLKTGLLLGASPVLSGLTSLTKSIKKMNTVRLLRHATLIVQIGDVKFLIDPMLSEKFAMEPVADAANNTRIPMVSLPVNAKEITELINEVDAVMITHTHRDHWDTAAQQLIPKDKPLFIQPVDEAMIKHQGFTNATVIADKTAFKGVNIHRTGGQHGKGEILEKMGQVSGFVFQHDRQSLYIAGDTIWCPIVEGVLDQYQPNHIVVNTGAPRFMTGEPITMTADDVVKVARKSRSAQVIAVHMETINHCTLTRAALRTELEKEALLGRVFIPADGQTMPSDGNILVAIQSSVKKTSKMKQVIKLLFTATLYRMIFSSC